MSSCQRTLQPYFDSTLRYKNLIAIPGTSKANNIQSNGGNQVLEGKDVDLGFFGQGDERQRGCEGSEGSHRQEKKQETIHANADLDNSPSSGAFKATMPALPEASAAAPLLPVCRS